MKAFPSSNNSVNSSQRLALTIRRLANALVDGDDGALAPLQRLSRLHPVAVADEIGLNLTDLAHDALVASLAGADGRCYTNMRVHLKLASATLAGDHPSPVMQACASWVAIMQAHANVEAAKAAKEQKGGHLLGLVSRELVFALKSMSQIAAIETRRSRRQRPKVINAEFKVIR